MSSFVQGRDVFCSSDTVCKVNWGEFDERGTVIATIASKDTFSAWKDEVFSLLETEWASLYPEDSQSRAILQEILDNYVLVRR